MIREITEPEVLEHFFSLMADLECGERFIANNPNHAQWLQKRISLRFVQGARFFGYFLADGCPAGFICFLIDEGPEGIKCFGNKSEILDFGLLPAHRSKGYGTDLLKHAERISAEAGAHVLYTSTYACNHRAILFYGRNGLVPVATLPDVHSPGDEGMVYMRKIIR
jgi:GNAT superfamily N-acetyltransferase